MGSSTYDRSRIYLLAAYCIQAKDVKHGRDWAARVLGLWMPPDNWGQALEATKAMKRPLYHVMWKSRIAVDPRPEVNVVMTGIRILMSPISTTRLSDNEIVCIEEALAYIRPVLLHGPPEAAEAVQALARATFRDKRYVIAS